jgi:hypothetical protein
MRSSSRLWFSADNQAKRYRKTVAYWLKHLSCVLGPSSESQSAIRLFNERPQLSAHGPNLRVPQTSAIDAQNTRRRYRFLPTCSTNGSRCFSPKNLRGIRSQMSRQATG